MKERKEKSLCLHQYFCLFWNETMHLDFPFKSWT